MNSDEWSYKDQKDWYKNNPECNRDRDESPRNLRDEETIFDTKKCTQIFEWSLNETHHTFGVVNNANTLEVIPVDSKDKNKVKHPIARFPNYFHQTQDDIAYCLDSFHFHWGLNDTLGSEHYINNKSYPLEAHFVHYDCEYGSILDAFKAYKNATDDHVLAVVAVLFEISETNNTGLEIILRYKLCTPSSNSSGPKQKHNMYKYNCAFSHYEYIVIKYWKSRCIQVHRM